MATSNHFFRSSEQEPQVRLPHLCCRARKSGHQNDCGNLPGANGTSALERSQEAQGCQEGRDARYSQWVRGRQPISKAQKSSEAKKDRFGGCSSLPRLLPF